MHVVDINKERRKKSSIFITRAMMMIPSAFGSRVRGNLEVFRFQLVLSIPPASTRTPGLWSQVDRPLP